MSRPPWEDPPQPDERPEPSYGPGLPPDVVVLVDGEAVGGLEDVPSGVDSSRITIERKNST